jgi:hypothetical protein
VAYHAADGNPKWQSLWSDGNGSYDLPTLQPHSLAVSPDGARVFVTGFTQGGTIDDSQAHRVPQAILPGGTDPQSLPFPQGSTPVGAVGAGDVPSTSSPFSIATVAYDAATGGQPGDCRAPGRILTEDLRDNGPWGLSFPAGMDLRYMRLAETTTGGKLDLRFQIGTDRASATTPPASGTFWETSFQGADGQVHGVRMVFTSKSPSTPTFQSFIAAPDAKGTTDGRTVKRGSEQKADKGSSYDPASGTIVINVPIKQLGLKPGDTITGFNTAVVNPDSMYPDSLEDQMPDDWNWGTDPQFKASWPFTIYANAQCPR